MPLVARGDVTVHLHTGWGEDMKGNAVEMTEGCNLKAGDPVDPELLAEYQQEALTNPDVDGGHFASLFTTLSDKEHAQLLASREEAQVNVSNESTKAEGDATITQTKQKEA